MIEKDELILLVGDADGEIGGCVQVHLKYKPEMYTDGRAEFEMLTVKSSLTKRGFGKVLIKAAEEMGRKDGAKTMVLMVFHPDPDHHLDAHKQFLFAWYKKLGYERTVTPNITDLFPEAESVLAFPCKLAFHEKSI